MFLLMDGHAMVHRAFHAIRQPMTTRSTGQEVRGAYGFMNSFLGALFEWRPTHCAVAFDMQAPTFRHLKYSEYKSHRPRTPVELQAQFPIVHQLMESFGVATYEMEGYEGDDVLGTLALHAERMHLDTIILTGDTDTLQLVSPFVRVALNYSSREKKIFDESAVRQRFGGLNPKQLPDVKALQGDVSDNIKGVPGIGGKTAVKLIQQFGSIESMYENLSQVAAPRIQDLLNRHRDQASLSKILATIVRDVPLDIDNDAMLFGNFDRNNVLETFRNLEFTSMVRRIPEFRMPHKLLPVTSDVQDRVDGQPQYRVVNSMKDLEAMVAELRSSGLFAFDTETSDINPMRCELVGLSFSVDSGRAFYVPVGHIENDQIPIQDVLAKLKVLLEDVKVSKVAHNANFDMTVLRNYGIEVRGLVFDTMVAAQMVGQNAIGLKQLAFQLLNEQMTTITEILGSGKKQITFDRVSIEQAAAYAAADADMTYRLHKRLTPMLERTEAAEVFNDVEIPLVQVLVQMQHNGISVAVDDLRQMSTNITGEIRRLEATIHKDVGEQFNINSPQQLGVVLFEKLLPLAKLRELGLPSPKRTKTGYSTDASVLDGLKGHPVVDNVLEYRQLTKLKSTYVDALPVLVNSITGRIHTRYNQVGSATGRLSSSDPNLQNIPIRTELGRQVRCAFVAVPGWSLLAVDYSQIELRVLAHLSGDDGLIEAFKRDEDIHAATASEVYGVSLDAVTPSMRRLAKVMNFGIIYGLSAHGMSQQTDLDFNKSTEFIEGYFRRYPGIRDYVQNLKVWARDRRYVETLSGRRRYIPEINDSNFHVRQAAERMAVNMPIQGTAADIIKVAMVRIHERMRRDSHLSRSRMLLQVHDELIFEVPPDEIEAMQSMVLELMPSAMKLEVPLKVEMKLGPTWGDLGQL